MTNDQAYLAAAGGYESRPRETQNMQQLMIISIAPFVETQRVSTQKSAEGDSLGEMNVSPFDEGPNARKSEAIS